MTPRREGAKWQGQPGFSFVEILVVALPARRDSDRGESLATPGTGLTLIEVLAVLGLVGILVLAALPQLTVPGTLSTAAAARQLAFDLRLARQLAIARRVNHSVELTPLAGPYTSYIIRNEATSATEPDFPKNIPSTITATGRAEFTFYPDGCVDDDGVGAGCVGTNGSVTLTAGSDTHRVDVFWPNGRVKVIRP